jgi:chromosome segregation ATPase
MSHTPLETSTDELVGQVLRDDTRRLREDLLQAQVEEALNGVSTSPVELQWLSDDGDNSHSHQSGTSKRSGKSHHSSSSRSDRDRRGRSSRRSSRASSRASSRTRDDKHRHHGRSSSRSQSRSRSHRRNDSMSVPHSRSNSRERHGSSSRSHSRHQSRSSQRRRSGNSGSGSSDTRKMTPVKESGSVSRATFEEPQSADAHGHGRRSSRNSHHPRDSSGSSRSSRSSRSQRRGSVSHNPSPRRSHLHRTRSEASNMYSHHTARGLSNSRRTHSTVDLRHKTHSLRLPAASPGVSGYLSARGDRERRGSASLRRDYDDAVRRAEEFDRSHKFSHLSHDHELDHEPMSAPARDLDSRSSGKRHRKTSSRSRTGGASRGGTVRDHDRNRSRDNELSSAHRSASVPRSFSRKSSRKSIANMFGPPPADSDATDATSELEGGPSGTTDAQNDTNSTEMSAEEEMAFLSKLSAAEKARYWRRKDRKREKEKRKKAQLEAKSRKQERDEHDKELADRESQLLAKLFTTGSPEVTGGRDHDADSKTADGTGASTDEASQSLPSADVRRASAMRRAAANARASADTMYSIHDVLKHRPAQGSWQVKAIKNICTLCKKSFGFTRQRHHCRFCGDVFCNSCSARERSFDLLGFMKKPVRVCDTCYNRPAPEKEAFRDLEAELADADAEIKGMEVELKAMQTRAEHAARSKFTENAAVLLDQNRLLKDELEEAEAELDYKSRALNDSQTSLDEERRRNKLAYAALEADYHALKAHVLELRQSLQDRDDQLRDMLDYEAKKQFSAAPPRDTDAGAGSTDDTADTGADADADAELASLLEADPFDRQLPPMPDSYEELKVAYKRAQQKLTKDYSRYVQIKIAHESTVADLKSELHLERQRVREVRNESNTHMAEVRHLENRIRILNLKAIDSSHRADIRELREQWEGQSKRYEREQWTMQAVIDKLEDKVVSLDEQCEALRTKCSKLREIAKQSSNPPAHDSIMYAPSIDDGSTNAELQRQLRDSELQVSQLRKDLQHARDSDSKSTSAASTAPSDAAERERLLQIEIDEMTREMDELLVERDSLAEKYNAAVQRTQDVLQKLIAAQANAGSSTALQEENQVLRSERQNAMREIETLEEKLRIAEEELHMATEELTQTEQRINVAETTLQDAYTLLQEKTSEVEALENQLQQTLLHMEQSSSESGTPSSAEVAALKLEIERCKSSLTQQQATTKRAEQEAAQMRSQYEELQQQDSSYTHRIKEALSREKQTLRKLSDVQILLGVSNSELSSLKQEKSNWAGISSKEAVGDRDHELQRVFTAMQLDSGYASSAESKEDCEESAKLREDSADSGVSMLQSQAQIKKIEHDLQNARDDLADSKDAQSRVQADADKLREQLTEARAKLAKTEAELALAQHAVAEAKLESKHAADDADIVREQESEAHRAQVDELIAKVARLESDSPTAEQVSELEQMCGELRASVATLTLASATAVREHEKAVEKQQLKASRVQYLETHTKQLQDQCDALSREVGRMVTERKTISANYAQSNTDMRQQYDEQVSALDATIVELKRDIASMYQAQQTHEEQKQQLESTIEKLELRILAEQKDKSRIAKQRGGSRRDYDGELKMLAHLEALNEQVRKSSSELRERSANMQTLLKEKNDEIARVRERNEAESSYLRAELDRQRKLADSLRSRLKLLENQLQQAESQTDEYKELLRQLSDTQSELKAMEDAIDSKTLEWQQKEAEFEQTRQYLEARSAAMGEAMSELVTQLESMESQCVEMSAQLEDQKHEASSGAAASRKRFISRGVNTTLVLVAKSNSLQRANSSTSTATTPPARRRPSRAASSASLSASASKSRIPLPSSSSSSSIASGTSSSANNSASSSRRKSKRKSKKDKSGHDGWRL